MKTDAYFLRTPRLGFRHWTSDDLPLAERLWGDPEVARYLGGPFTPEQIKAKLSREITHQQTLGFQYWPFFLLGSGEHAGCCGLRPYKPEEGILEIGFHLHRAHWGKGIAVEASRAVIDYAFDTVGAAALFAGHYPANHASRKVLLRLGFQYDGEKVYPVTGLMEPTYLLTPHARIAHS